MGILEKMSAIVTQYLGVMVMLAVNRDHGFECAVFHREFPQQGGPCVFIG
ncbi:hypothetical protein JCM19237_6601 [Photobacterium aphoticum]|uniref:Uncharacterized protein n=1 Tax=Photobacterium aphoticum TaxID=754436 RepID=A0A090R7V0_9GAMM|nr:hypothetical protein JCM19237_6601 [Photobacterium aphoticum]